MGWLKAAPLLHSCIHKQSRSSKITRVERLFTDLHGENPKKDIQFYITSLSAEEADSQALLEIIRGQWSIENSLHWVRDVIFDEDRSQIRIGSEPRVFASIRNLAISLLNQSFESAWIKENCHHHT
jgi:predicted transposase YbfD/YdcC